MKNEYELKVPIEVEGEESIKLLKFAEPDIKKLELYEVDLSESALTKVSGMKRIICACCTNIGEAHINLIKCRDLTGAMAKCESFFV